MADFDAPKSAGFVVPEIPFDTDAGGKGEGALAPLIFNAWYVLAKSGEVDRNLKNLKVLGQPLVYYRTEEGVPVVLDDRCAHRRFPLSKGRLIGDAIECGYHGFTYAQSGKCIWAPGVPRDGESAKNLPFGVRSYPCAERGPWLWVWMGAPDLADPAQIPMPKRREGVRFEASGYKFNYSNYMLVIENILDLSHVHFLHSGAADINHAVALPHDMPAPPNAVAWQRVTERTEIGALGAMFGEDPAKAVRLVDDLVQTAPSVTDACMYRTALDTESPGEVKPATFSVVHALTPADDKHTHQFFMMGFSDPLQIDEKEFITWLEDVLFEEDVDALRHVQDYIEEDIRPGRVEFGMAGDRFGLKMRKILKEMKALETSAPATII